METALIVEDDTINQKLLKTILTSSGYNTITADNGEEALLHYRKKTEIDIILLDMHMPYLSGLETVRMIRDIEKNEKREHIPVIAVTAFALDGNRETCLDAGCDDYIAKPYDQKILIEMLNKYSSQ